MPPNTLWMSAIANPEPDIYYEWSRPELRALVPHSASRVSMWAADERARLGAEGGPSRASVHGIEYVPERRRSPDLLDDVIAADLDAIESLPKHWAPFDAVICGDVLEHLRDPARVLTILRNGLSPAGVIIASIPNIKDWSVLYPLLVQDRFTYQDSGLLDRTHVHFLTLRGDRRDVHRLRARSELRRR